MNEKTVKAFSLLFTGFTKAHGVYALGDTVDGLKQKGEADVKYLPASPDDYARHLRGENPGIGIIPLMDDNKSVKFGVIDIDVYDGLDFKKIERDLKGTGIPCTICKSKSGGAQIYYFFSRPISAETAKEKLTSVAALLGYGHSEIFPKQISRRPGLFTGNWINLPYFGNTRRAFAGGKELTLQQFLKQAVKINPADFNKAVVTPKGALFQDGPPCLQQMFHEGVQEGTRNMVMFNAAMCLKIADGDNWAKSLVKLNGDLSKPLPSTEIQGIANSIKGKSDYNYQCRQEPLISFCNRKLCLERKYGISCVEEEFDVHIVQLMKLDTKPPIWIAELADGQTIEISDTGQLLNQKRFQTLCVETLNIWPNTIKNMQWVRLVQDLLKNVKVIGVPDDASLQGQFVETFVNWLSHSISENETDLFLNKAIDDGKDSYLFKSYGLFEYLRKIHFRYFTPPQIFALLRAHGCTCVKYKVNNEQFDVWKIKKERFNLERDYQIKRQRRNY